MLLRLRLRPGNRIGRASAYTGQITADTAQIVDGRERLWLVLLQTFAVEEGDEWQTDGGGTRSSAPARGPRCSCGRWSSTTPTGPSWSRWPTSTRPGCGRTTAGSSELGAPPVPTYPADDVRRDARQGAGRRGAGDHRRRDPRRLHRGRARAGCDVDHREADDHRRRRAAGASWTPCERTGRRVRSPSTTATTRCTSRSASCSPAARSARSARCTSSGCSTCATAPTTSGAGTATRPTPAACWCTRRATTSTWSTGGWARRRVEVYAEGRLFFYGEAGRRHGYARDYERAHGAPAAADDPFALHLADNPRPARALPRRRGRRRLPCATATSSRPASPSRTTWRCWSRYSTGATMTYHLTAYAPWEGYRVMFNGSRGRLELEVVESDHVSPPAPPARSRAPPLHGARGRRRAGLGPADRPPVLGAAARGAGARLRPRAATAAPTPG